MFGIDQNIKSSQLYLLYDMAKNQLATLREELDKIDESDNREKVSEIKMQISHFEQEINQFENKIAKEPELNFNFSIEEIYSIYGQYEENFISVEFHRNTESFEKYGETIGGSIVYRKSERENLEKELNSENPKRTNDFVKLDSTPEYPLGDSQRQELIETGFRSGDVYEIIQVNLPRRKSYRTTGVKEIPNRINIEIDPDDFDLHAMTRGFLGRLLADGKQLIPYEYFRYLALVEDVNPEALENEGVYEQIKSNGKKAMGLFRYHQLKVKIETKKATEEEKSEFLRFRSRITNSRIEIIKEEVRKSANKPLKLYLEENPDFILNFAEHTMSFEEETLEYFRSTKPIYWNFKSVAHIYLRHTQDLSLKGVNELKSNFQYELKEVRYILKKCIEDNIEEINERLANGKEFRLYGDRSYYFNGNYYSMNIDKNGRVSSFYPNVGINAPTRGHSLSLKLPAYSSIPTFEASQAPLTVAPPRF